MLAALLSLSLAQPAAPLYSFEDGATAGTPNNVRLAVAPRGATHGKQALQVEFLPAEWPNVAFKPAAPWNWANTGGLLLDVTNPGKEPVQFHVRIDDDPAADGITHCRTGVATVAPGRTETCLVPFAVDPMSVGMRGLPGAVNALAMPVHGTGPFDPSHIVMFQVFLSGPKAPVMLILDNIRTAPALNLDGIVDNLGQYARAAWPGKVRSVEEMRRLGRAEQAALAAAPRLAGRTKYGGWADGPTLKATGFFRTEKVDGKWWLVDPEGRLFFSVGMDCVNLFDTTIVTGRERMFTWLPERSDPLARHFSRVSGVHSGPVKEGEAFSFYNANLQRKHGAEYFEPWKRASIDRLLSWGFNTVANWSHESFARNGRVPYVASAGIGGSHARISSGSDYWGRMHDPFDPRFAIDAADGIRGAAARSQGDPWCIGYFVDNELSWSGRGEDGGRYGLGYGALAEPGTSHAKQAFLGQLRAKYGDVGAFNTAWNASATSWDALAAPFDPGDRLTGAAKADMAAFVKSLALRYFTVVRDAVRAADPDHLYLGCRFAWRNQDAVQAAAEVGDVVSFNIYAPTVDPAAWKFAADLDVPCIIGEFHFGALDRGMFHTGLVAASSQAERASMYAAYVRSVLDHPAFVGCHWFQYVDEPITGRYFDGENYNIGFVTVTDTPYPEMVAAARRVHAEAYARRAGRAR